MWRSNRKGYEECHLHSEDGSKTFLRNIVKFLSELYEAPSQTTLFFTKLPAGKQKNVKTMSPKLKRPPKYTSKTAALI